MTHVGGRGRGGKNDPRAGFLRLEERLRLGGLEQTFPPLPAPQWDDLHEPFQTSRISMTPFATGSTSKESFPSFQVFTVKLTQKLVNCQIFFDRFKIQVWNKSKKNFFWRSSFKPRKHAKLVNKTKFIWSPKFLETCFSKINSCELSDQLVVDLNLIKKAERSEAKKYQILKFDILTRSFASRYLVSLRLAFFIKLTWTTYWHLTRKVKYWLQNSTICHFFTFRTSILAWFWVSYLDKSITKRGQVLPGSWVLRKVVEFPGHAGDAQQSRHFQRRKERSDAALARLAWTGDDVVDQIVRQTGNWINQLRKLRRTYQESKSNENQFET